MIHPKGATLVRSPSVIIINEMLTAAITIALQSHSVPAKKVHEKTPQYEVTLTIPALPSAEASKTIEDWARKYADEWKNFIKDDTSERPNPYAYEVSPLKTFKHGNFVSQSMFLYQFSGGAHPAHNTFVFNLLTEGGEARKVETEEFFKKGVDPYKLLSPILINNLRKQKAAWIVEGMYTSFVKTFREGNDGTTQLPIPSLSAKGMSFLFDAYAVGSYAEGDYKVFVPWSRVSKDLDRPFVKKLTGY